MSKYIPIVDLLSGSRMDVSRHEINDAAIEHLNTWLRSLLDSGERLPLPNHHLYHCCASAETHNGALVVTIWAPRGPYIEGVPCPENAEPAVTLLIAGRSRHTQAARAIILAKFEVNQDLHMPPAPWCAIATHALAVGFRKSAKWVDQFARELSWAWMERSRDGGEA